MSNLQKSSSRFSSRRFAIAIAMLAISTGAVHAENRESAISVSAPASPLAELVQETIRLFCRLAGGGEDCKPQAPAPVTGQNQTEGEIDTEIEIEPPSYP
jgi:hypothetical protein